MPEGEKAKDTFGGWALTIMGSLCVLMIIGGITMYGDMRELKTKMDILQADSLLDQEQSASLSKLWKAAGQNRGFINRLREVANADHTEREPVGQFEWKELND